MLRKRLTDGLFLAIVSVILVSPVLFKVAANNGVQFPDWLGVNSSRSVIEGRNYEKLPTPSPDSFSSGKLQAATENYLSDAVPARDSVLFGNAGLQRSFINVASIPFGFASIPTFFGSAYTLNDGLSLAKDPMRKAQATETGLQSFGHGLASIAMRHPEKRFIVYVVDAASNSESNRVTSLVHNVENTRMACKTLIDATSEAVNVLVVSKQYTSDDEFRADFFRTDHHWNIRGAAGAYNCIAEVLGLRLFDPEPVQVVGDTAFSGSYATSGLCPLQEDPIDTSFDFSELTLLDKNGERTDDSAHEPYWSVSEAMRRRYFYDCWYGWRDTSPVILGKGDHSAVFISDSYGFAMKRIVALNYKTLYTDCDLHADNSSKTLSLEERLVRDDVQDVIFVASVSNYVGMSNRMPRYFAVDGNA